MATQLITGMIVGVWNAASLNLNGHSVGHWDDSRCSECCIAKLEWPLSWMIVDVRNAASLNLNGHSVGHWDDSRCSECCIAKLEWSLSWSLG